MATAIETSSDVKGSKGCAACDFCDGFGGACSVGVALSVLKQITRCMLVCNSRVELRSVHLWRIRMRSRRGGLRCMRKLISPSSKVSRQVKIVMFSSTVHR